MLPHQYARVHPCTAWHRLRAPAGRRRGQAGIQHRSHARGPLRRTRCPACAATGIPPGSPRASPEAGTERIGQASLVRHAFRGEKAQVDPCEKDGPRAADNNRTHMRREAIRRSPRAHAHCRSHRVAPLRPAEGDRGDRAPDVELALPRLQARQSRRSCWSSCRTAGPLRD
jgi:hypothetical protein